MRNNPALALAGIAVVGLTGWMWDHHIWPLDTTVDRVCAFIVVCIALVAILVGTGGKS